MELFKLLGTIAVDISDADAQLDNIITKAERTSSGFGKAFGKVGDVATKAGEKMLPLTVGIGGLATSTSKMAMDFEYSMAKVSTIADSTEVPLDKLQNSIIELSNQTGISSSEIAENVYNAISAGQKTGDAVAFVENATKLAKAGFAESGDALDILTTIMNSYGLEADQVTKVSDNLITTQNLGKTTVAELSSAMGKAIPTAKSVGVNLDELCASYAVMTSNGIATAETTTYLNSMLNELGKQGTSAAKAFAEGTEHIKKGGLTMAEAMEQGWGLSDVLSILDEQAAESGSSINNLFGSAEAGKAAAVLWDNAQSLNSAVMQMGESAGSTEEAFGKLDTTSYNAQKTLNILKNTGIELGTTIVEMLVPFIDKLSEKVSKLSEWFGSLSDEQKESIVKFAAIVAAAAPLLIVIGKVFSAVDSVITVTKKIITFAKLLIPLISGISAPMLAVIAVIGLLVAAGVSLYKNWDTIKENAKKLWNSISETFNNIKNSIKEKIDSAKESVRNAIEKIKGFFKFEWSLPKLKLPHFSISGKFSLDPPSIPKIGVDWYAKAMDEPMIMNSPTAFGINNLGQIMAGGEKGSEVVSGTDTLMGMIRQAVSENNSAAQIAEAVRSAVIEGLETIDFSAFIKVEPDDRRLFKVVEKQAKIQKKSTGREVFT